MSKFWQPELAETATAVPPWVRQGDIEHFRPWSLVDQENRHSSLPRLSNADHDPSPVHDGGDLQARAFAEGFEEGRRAVEELVNDERAALAHLMQSLETLRPEPSKGLAMLLAETVERLVHQIMGEVTIDKATLHARALGAAELIGEESGRLRLRLHPEDLALLEGMELPAPAVADPHLMRGTVMLETDEGWIEDGPEARLEKLRAALDRMGLAPRGDES